MWFVQPCLSKRHSPCPGDDCKQDWLHSLALGLSAITITAVCHTRATLHLSTPLPMLHCKMQGLDPWPLPVWRYSQENLVDMPRSTLITILAAAFWLCVITTLFFALSPRGNIPGVNDKALHMLAFACLACLACAAFPFASMIRVFFWLCLFGGAIELAQMIPQLHRDAEIADWLADTVAIAAVLFAIKLSGFRAWCAKIALANLARRSA